ncbi:MAG: 50S ribosomal protein L25 [Acidimicrobiia bacterium]|nr:50S ribosomal protein L25 [Acidimicrobiia bacterium]
MSETTLRAEIGRVTGSRPARRLRREGLVPATLYGKDSSAVNLAVESRELRRALTTDAGFNAILNIDVDGASHTALAREVQRHPVRGEIIHVDFVKILLTDTVEAEVSIEFVGEPIGVREDGGIVETVTTSVTLKAVVTNIPDSIELDISELHIGDSLKLVDLPVIEGVEYVDDDDLTLVNVSVPAAILAEEEEAEEGEEVEEGEEGAEGAEGGTAESDKDGGDE